MITEEKELLLKDLCARLPYGVKYCRDSWNYEWDQEMSVVEVLEDIDKDGYINHHKVYKVWDIKPYLRPMSSMTEEELDEYEKANDLDTIDSSETLRKNMEAKSRVRISKWYHGVDWLNAHHFDYRGLIDRGLALEALKGMYE